MIIDYDKREGHIRITKEYIFLGFLSGSFTIEKGGILYQKGSVSDNLILEKDSSAIISGTVNGDVINNGGALSITAEGMILGNIVTNSGSVRYLE